MEQEIQVLRKSLEAAKCAVRDLCFVNMLSGGVYDTEDALRAAAQESDLFFPYPCFLVLIAKKERWGLRYTQGQADNREYQFILRNTLENGLPERCQAAMVRGEMTAILNLPQAPEPRLTELVAQVSDLLETLDNEMDISATVAISRVYDSVMDLPQAYLDCQHVLEYQQVMGADAPVTTYEQLTHPYLTPPGGNYFTTVQKLSRCVQNRDFERLQLEVHNLMDQEFDASRPTVDTFRFRVYGVVNMLLYLMNDIRAVAGNDIVDELDVGPRLTSARSIESLMEEVDRILDALIAYHHTQQSPAAPAWVAQMRQYIRENYKDPDTTVASVADHFHMTPTYCSKLYREVYGIRLLEEIQRLRLEEAKRLLQGRDSIRAVAEKAGFPSTLTMSRAFKRYEATLPSSFRSTGV